MNLLSQENLPLLLVFLLEGTLAAALIIYLSRVIPCYMMKKDRHDLFERTRDISILEANIDESQFKHNRRELITIVALSILTPFLLFISHPATRGLDQFHLYFFALILLAAINIKHGYFPDQIVLPLMWFSLCFHAIQGDSGGYVLGAAAGYLAPLALKEIVMWKKKVDSIGNGDLKYFAMTGAWFGIDAVPSLFTFFFVGGIVSLVYVSFTKRLSLLPTGVAHVIASACLLYFRFNN